MRCENVRGFGRCPPRQGGAAECLGLAARVLGYCTHCVLSAPRPGGAVYVDAESAGSCSKPGGLRQSHVSSYTQALKCSDQRILTVMPGWPQGVEKKQKVSEILGVGAGKDLCGHEASSFVMARSLPWETSAL